VSDTCYQDIVMTRETTRRGASAKEKRNSPGVSPLRRKAWGCTRVWVLFCARELVARDRVVLAQRIEVGLQVIDVRGHL
jgi:hypothetical protein